MNAEGGQEYLDGMRLIKTWGTQLETDAASRVLNRTIVNHVCNRATGKVSSIEIHEAPLIDLNPPIYIKYNGINHYQAYLPTGQNFYNQTKASAYYKSSSASTSTATTGIQPEIELHSTVSYGKLTDECEDELDLAINDDDDEEEVDQMHQVRWFLYYSLFFNHFKKTTFLSKTIKN